MNEIIHTIEEYPAISTIIATIIISAIGFIIKRIFFEKQDPDNKSKFDIGKVKGDLIAGNKTVNKNKYLNTTISGTNNFNIQTFEEYIKKEKWIKEFINEKEIWICEKDNTFQIEIGNEAKEYSEKWTQVYPDSYGSHRYSVYLKINSSQIKELYFISMDGGRIFVPMTKMEIFNNEPRFYWVRDSLEFNMGKLIGEFYRWESMEGISIQSSIDIR